ncbi:winged helix DNA-binding domain-containing protein [Parenemella sanctibonifatiensis]|nr:winged helix DNA-binding domain-containing protein [Parenemella sanctibonifatiensis]
MVNRTLVRHRIVAQGLTGPAPGVSTPDPSAVVRQLVAMQGQDLPGVVASIALRSTGAVADVLAAFERGEIVRGYPMRGTVFAVAAEDLAWLTELCAGGALRAAAARRPDLGLTDEHLATAEELVLEHAGDGISRAALQEQFAAAQVPTEKGCFYHLVAHLVGTGVAVYGPTDGKDQEVRTAAWLPAGGLEHRFNGDRDAAIQELIVRYFHGHGPATLRDLAWWSKLGLTELRRNLTVVQDQLEGGELAGEAELWWRPGLLDEVAAAGRSVDRERLLPGFDELVLGTQDRGVVTPEAYLPRLAPGNNGVFGKSVTAGGAMIGLWKRAGRPRKRMLELEEFATISPTRRVKLQRLFEDFPFVDE